MPSSEFFARQVLQALINNQQNEIIPMLHAKDFKQAILAVDALGATPAVLNQVIKLAKDPNTDIQTLAALMKNDGALAVDIIRISNSPYYAPATLHTNLTSAVNSIGLKEVIRAVHMSMARQLFARDLPSYGVTAYDYWASSIAAALLMEALAKLTSLDPEDAYTIGILHAVGRVLINRVIVEQGFSIYWNGQDDLNTWEKSSVGFDHAEAGALLLEHWRFASSTCEVIRQQNAPGQANEPLSLVSMLRFTLRILTLTNWDFSRENVVVPAQDAFLKSANISAGTVHALIAHCKADFQRILQSVDIK